MFENCILGTMFAHMSQKELNMLEKNKSYKDVTTAEFDMLQSLSNQGQHQVAISLAKKLLKDYVVSSTLNNFIGVSYSNLGENHLAINYFKRSIELSPNFSHAYNNLGVSYLQLQEIEKAKSSFEEATRLSPEIPHFHYNLSKPLYVNSEHELAIKALKKAISLRRNYPNAFNDLGNCLVEVGQMDEAISAYHQALKLDPNYIEAYGNIGLTYFKMGKPEEALNGYIKALELNPSCGVTKANLVELLKEKNFDDVKGHQILALDSKIKQKDIKNFQDATNDIIINDVSVFLKTLKQTEPNLRTKATQLFKRNSADLNCKRHLKLFATHKVIPEFCFGCFKVQVEVKNVLDLIRLASLFYNIDFGVNLTRKCMIETRSFSGGFYKGFIYCSSLQQAKGVVNKLSHETTNLDWQSIVKIKRGCTEYALEYPGFENVDKDAPSMTYPESWKEQEIQFDKKYSLPPLKTKLQSLSGFCLSDLLVIERWIDYAKGIGDSTVEAFQARPVKYADTYELAKCRIEKIPFIAEA